MPYNKNNIKRAKDDVTLTLTALNNHLLNSTFLVGERVTLADINVFATLLHLYQYVLEPSFREPFGNVTRWFKTILNQPQVKKVIPAEYALATKELEFDPKKYAEFSGKAGVADKKEPKPAKQEKPKQEKAKKEVEPVEELDPAEEALRMEPKSNNPFDELEKGTFNFDDFKRCYSNEDEAKSIPYFWEKFDHDKYSIWFGEYKYNNELSKVFMSCNLITGLFVCFFIFNLTLQNEVTII